MFERLRQVAVESFVGAIALGYLLAQVIMHFVGIFASPVQAWVTQRELHLLTPGGTAAAPTGLSFQNAAPELIRFLLLAAVWYVLMRWLYFRPLRKEPPGPPPNPSLSE
jgi:hypothetical protein